MAKVYPTTVGPHEYIYYQIPKDEVFYRGDTQIYMNEGELPEGPTFFGNLKKRVKKYGMVFRFKTRKPLLLLALDKNKKIAGEQDNLKVYEDAPENIKTILKNNYGFDTPKGLRETEFKKDHELLKYLCNELNIDGYYNNEMAVPDDIYVDEFEDDGTEDTDPSKFHSEMGLCDVRNNMELVNYREDMDKYSEEERLTLSQKKKAMDIKYDEDEKRNKGKKSRRRTSSEEEFSDPFGLSEGTGSISLSGLSSEHDSDNDNQPMMQQAIFRNTMDSPQGSRSSNRSSSSSSSSMSPSSPISSSRSRGQRLFSIPAFSPGLENVPEDRAFPRTFSNLEDRLALGLEEDNFSTRSTPKRRESPVPFSLLLEEADGISTPTSKFKKQKTPKKGTEKGGKKKVNKKSKKIKKKMRKNKATKKRKRKKTKRISK